MSARLLRSPGPAAVTLFLLVACGGSPEPRSTDAPGAAAAAGVADTASPGAFRLIGTEPFWGLHVDRTGLRYTTPDDTAGIRFPPLTPTRSGDTLRWTGETERASIDARIWPRDCSDGMSDKVWPYAAAVRIRDTTHQGCAEPRPR